MNYVVQMELPAEVAPELERTPQELEEWVGKWQDLNPIGMYFHLARRAVTVIVDVPNEDALFEALHATWIMAKTYPTVSPVVDASEFPNLLQRIGMSG